MFQDFIKKFAVSAFIPIATILMLVSSNVDASVIIYKVDAGTSGAQSYTGSLGMDFTTSSSITITHLGAFDSDGDGISGLLTTEIWTLGGGSMLASATFSGVGDPTFGTGSRFQAITPLILPAGSYTVLSYGYSAADPNGNANLQPTTWSNNSFGGVITFDGYRFNSSGITTYPAGPTLTAGANPDRKFAAGTFIVTPEPEVYLTLGSFALVLAFMARRKKSLQS